MSTPSLGKSVSRKCRAPLGIAASAKRAKYGNRWTEYKGVRYQSAREAHYAAELDLQQRCGLIAGWRRQAKFALEVNDRFLTYLIIDFVIMRNGQPDEYIEVKGHPTAEFKLKWKIFRALRPDLNARIVK
jgi:hypothetical protein